MHSSDAPSRGEPDNGDPQVDLASGSWGENGSARVVVEGVR
jgi:hypothetical protein